MFIALLDMMAFEWNGQEKLAPGKWENILTLETEEKQLVINDYIGLLCYLIFIL
jgi:hypothetical protein